MRPTEVADGPGRPFDNGAPLGRQDRRWTLIAGVEAVLAAVAVILDVGIPTLVILALMVVSLIVRRQGLPALGLHAVPHGWLLAAKMLAFAAGWTLVNVGLLKPIENRITGTTQDMSQFMPLEGNLTMLLALLALSWTLAAVGEELAFRGFVQTRLTEVVGAAGARLGIAVALSSVLFGLLHTEQGSVGVLVSSVNGLFYCVLRYHYRTLWAPILAHGFIDTIGFVSFYLIGPVYGLW